MSNRASQIDVSKAFPADFARDNLDSTFFTDNPPVLHALVFTAVTFVILGRTKDLGTEKPVTFRLESPVIYGFRLFHLTERAFTDFLRMMPKTAEWS